MKESTYKSYDELPLFLSTKKGPQRNPAERFRWGEAELRSEHVFALLGGNEGYEAIDDDKQDKGKGGGSPATPCGKCEECEADQWAHLTGPTGAGSLRGGR